MRFSVTRFVAAKRAVFLCGAGVFQSTMRMLAWVWWHLGIRFCGDQIINCLSELINQLDAQDTSGLVKGERRERTLLVLGRCDVGDFHCHLPTGVLLGQGIVFLENTDISDLVITIQNPEVMGLLTHQNWFKETNPGFKVVCLLFAHQNTH
jgi:hypothetical protein